MLRDAKKQDHGIDQRIDYRIMEEAKEALENKTPVSLKMPINNLDRTTGTILSYNISTKYDTTKSLELNGCHVCVCEVCVKCV